MFTSYWKNTSPLAMPTVIRLLRGQMVIFPIPLKHTRPMATKPTAILQVRICRKHSPLPKGRDDVCSFLVQMIRLHLRRKCLISVRRKRSGDKGLVDSVLMTNVASYLADKNDIGDEEIMDRLAFTLGHRRSLLEWREAVSASTVSELSNALSSTDGNYTRPSGKPTLGFAFTGQGAQWFAMGRELLYYPVFAESLQESDRILAGLGAKWSLLGRNLVHCAMRYNPS